MPESETQILRVGFSIYYLFKLRTQKVKRKKKRALQKQTLKIHSMQSKRTRFNEDEVVVEAQQLLDPKAVVSL